MPQHLSGPTMNDEDISKMRDVRVYRACIDEVIDVLMTARWQVFDHPEDTECGLIDALKALKEAIKECNV
jgi:hypothetical protein